MGFKHCFLKSPETYFWVLNNACNGITLNILKPVGPTLMWQFPFSLFSFSHQTYLTPLLQHADTSSSKAITPNLTEAQPWIFVCIDGDEDCKGVSLVLDEDEGMRSFREEKGKRRNSGRRRATVKWFSSLSSLINIILYRLSAFLKIKHTHTKHIFYIFQTLKHVIWNIIPNLFFALWTLETRVSTILFKPQLSHHFKQRCLEFATKRDMGHYLYHYLGGFSYLEPSFFWLKNALTCLCLCRDKTKRQSGKNITLTLTKILPKK